MSRALKRFHAHRSANHRRTVPCDQTVRRWRIDPWPLALLCGLVLLLMSASLVRGDEPLVVPGVFRKTVPQSLQDIREIEVHVRKLVEQSRKSTVCLRVGRSFGTGVIVSEDGLILTAGHVISRPGRPVEVTLWDGTIVAATTLGRNRSLDSGMVQLPKDRVWDYARLSTQTQPYPGTWCLAMGHPGGFDGKRGVVARLGRIIMTRKRLWQTDCELVGGDSGGPLFDMEGHVLAIHSRIGTSTNYNYHVPISIFTDEWERLKAGEDLAGHSGALLGVNGTPNAEGTGLTITKVYAGDPAEKAGLKVGDVLLKFNSKEVKTLEKLTELVGEELPGTIVPVEILRNGSPQKIEVELGMRWD